MDESGDFDYRNTFWKKLCCWLFHSGMIVHYISKGYSEEGCYNGCYQKTYLHRKETNA